MFSKYKEKESQLDLADRKAYLVETVFETVLKEEVVYTCWARLDTLQGGLSTYNKWELLDSTLTVGEKTYNVKHIVHLESKVIKEGLVKKSIKKEKGGYKWSDITPWTMCTKLSEDEIESH